MRIVILGNAGSGKSTLAKAIAARMRLVHLDLDVIAWDAVCPSRRADPQQSRRMLLEFIASNERWVIEGCYAGLLGMAAAHCTELIFVNPGVEACVANCRARPWEPHKHPSKEEQDANLEALLAWVRQYAMRDDEFSLRAHRELFDRHQGAKVELGSNAAAARYGLN